MNEQWIAFTGICEGLCRRGHFTSLSEVLTRSNPIALIWKCAACQFPRRLSPRFLRYHRLIWIAQIAVNPYHRSVERSPDLPIDANQISQFRNGERRINARL